MVTLTIDAREIQAEEGKTILEVARDNNIYIPALCYHEEVAPYGACRLCLVEITRNGRKRLVTSCLYPAEEGLVVQTNTERVVANRKMLMELLLARCSDLAAVQELARELGVEETPFPREKEQCILCGLCTRVCQEVVGTSAIGLFGRGVDKNMATPFYEFPETCIACGSCAYVCPVRTIKLEDAGDTRTITLPNPKVDKLEFKLKKCQTCGSYWAPERQLDYIIKKAGLPADAFDKCPDCRD